MVEPSTRPLELSVNGAARLVHADPGESLMSVLRHELGCVGVRSGCGIGACGACTVVIDGLSQASCVTDAESVASASITTPEGLGTPERPHPVQQQFIDEQAGQCGYCVNGIIMTVWALTQQNPPPARTAVDQALEGHLCRCAAYVRIRRAAYRLLGFPSPDAIAEIRCAAPPAPEGDGEAHRQPVPPMEVERAPLVEDWLELLPDGRVAVRCGKAELGQGIRVAAGQVVAAQLGLASELVVVGRPGTDRSPDQGYTSGSRSLQEGGVAWAMAAAAFRRLVLERAAARLSSSPEALRLCQDGVVRPRDTAAGAGIGLQTLARDGGVAGAVTAADQPVWSGAPFGESAARSDLRAKLSGAPAYVHDRALPGMAHARATLPPTYDATLDEVDSEPVRQLPGVIDVLVDERLLVVLAERPHQAERAAEALARRARWRTERLGFDGGVDATLRTLPATPIAAREDAAVEEALADDVAYSARYTKPYQVHGAVAPSCAVALASEEKLTVWSHTQGVHPLRRELAVMLNMPVERIEVAHEDGPGCYGMNGADDAAAFAALAARALPGRPVRFELSVHQEFGWEPYGTAMSTELTAAVDRAGRLRALRHRGRTDTHSARPRGSGNGLAVSWLRSDGAARPWRASSGGTRNIVPIYDIPAVEAVAEHVNAPLRTGSLRSLSAFTYVFAIESFMDELAELAGEDPLAYRLAHLRDARAREVLETAAGLAGWQPRVGPSGRGQGLALLRYNARMAYMALAADVTFDSQTGRIGVKRLSIACDAGVVVNPEGLRNQLEGGALQGLSRTLHEELRVDERGVQSLDWLTYPSLRHGQAPDVDIVLLDRPGSPPLGSGEVAPPAVPAAVANAVDDAVGLRLRDLPFTSERVEQRVLGMEEAELARVRGL